MGQGVSQPGGSGCPTPAPGGAGVGAFRVEFPFAGENAHISAVIHPTSNGGPPLAVLVCWPGGSDSRAYWDMHVPGHTGYSFAEHLCARGFTVVSADPLGVGESAKPADVDAVTLETMADAAAEFVGALRAELAAGDVPVIAVGHSLGGWPKGFFGADWDAGYSLTPRAANHFWIHRPDVPADVIAADDREAAQVACPVFVAFGDHDVPEHPHDDVSFYGASDDVTLMVLADSAHCHNFAGYT